MKVDKVKVLMYGMSCSSTLARPSCITQYGHTNVMTGGVRFGLCTEEERGVMELLDEVEKRTR